MMLENDEYLKELVVKVLGRAHQKGHIEGYKNGRVAGVKEGIKKATEIIDLHNLLKFISEGNCGCDPEVGACPCQACAAKDILDKLDAIDKEYDDEG